ncbi:M23 family metallopeptidase [Pseudohalocynthiibacter aestuariivivens]|nr:M23 family metallopeptidase [Pseudohalocynthiibacter aestuariivivens]QIE45481.1 M23 family metallopeptidase [Pseudohalocynthiibacter aestuariivivens]
MRDVAWAALAAALIAIPGLTSERLELGLPVDCELGKNCHIQQYVDYDPGPGQHDFMCRNLSYDGHKGTDFGLISYVDMHAGVDVIATAPGTVRGIRDDMPDRLYTDDMAEGLQGRACGNGVVIDHGDGWETQYCHMAKGSVTVSAGDQVKRGTPLGQIGLSGRTQFPHLHLSVRKDGAVVDPFDPDGAITCGAPSTDTLWIDPPAYQPGGLLAVGLGVEVPEFEVIRAGHAHSAQLPATAPALVAWGYAFGGEQADIVRIDIIGPEGRVFDHDALLKKPQAQLFRAAGRRLRGTGWPVGRYRVVVELIRDGKVIDRMQGHTDIE